MRRILSLAVPVTMLLAGCGPRSVETTLVFNVRPTDEGARIEVLVEGGPPDEAWVGFGVGPGVPSSRVERISDVRARGSDGMPLEVTPHGYAGYGVDVRGQDSWQLSYDVDLRPRPGEETFYRASVRGPDYLVLVGSDAWPRLFVDSRPLSFAPDNRPPGRADIARVTLDVASDSDWEVLATGDDVTRRSFRFAEHPATTVILAGRFRGAEAAPGLAMRVHSDWNILTDSVADMTSALATELHERLGPPSDLPGLAVMLPLPAPIRPSGGLRTAGMVRGRTVLLYGGLSVGVNRGSPRIREAMAVFIGHELFHLYVPSALPVARELSWMSEGWAMHMARIVAVDRGFVEAASAERELQRTYRRYLDMGGYRAGSLPAASMGEESVRDLLYLRGELVFRLLAREWASQPRTESFEEYLWRELTAIERSGPLEADEVNATLGAMIGDDFVRRYVQGTAPLTHGALGLDR